MKVCKQNVPVLKVFDRSRSQGRTSRRRKVSGESSNNPSRLVELLRANPFITIKGVADKLAIAFTTAQRAIERLERVNIVKQVGDAKRDRVYCATRLMDILEEPARLKPVANK